MLKNSQDNMKMVLEKLKYIEYHWTIIADFKMVGFLMEMQAG